MDLRLHSEDSVTQGLTKVWARLQVFISLSSHGSGATVDVERSTVIDGFDPCITEFHYPRFE